MISFVLHFSNNCTPWIIVELYRHFGFFTLGALTTLLFTELAKYTIGRLRPHYLTVCGPRLKMFDSFGQWMNQCATWPITGSEIKPMFWTSLVRLTPELCLDEFGYQKFVLVDEEEMCESVKDRVKNGIWMGLQKPSLSVTSSIYMHVAHPKQLSI